MQLVYHPRKCTNLENIMWAVHPFIDMRLKHIISLTIVSEMIGILGLTFVATAALVNSHRRTLKGAGIYPKTIDHWDQRICNDVRPRHAAHAAAPPTTMHGRVRRCRACSVPGHLEPEPPPFGRDVQRSCKINVRKRRVGVQPTGRLKPRVLAQRHTRRNLLCRSMPQSTSGLKQGLTIEVASVLKILPQKKSSLAAESITQQTSATDEQQLYRADLK